MIVAAVTPMPKPAATRASVTSVSRCNSPLRARSTKVAKMTDGGGASRPLAQPMRTMNSHATASATGSTRPSAGRAKRDQRRAFARSAGAASLVSPSLRSALGGNRHGHKRHGARRKINVVQNRPVD